MKISYKNANVQVVADDVKSVWILSKLTLLYNQVEDYIARDSFFQVSYEPVEVGARAPQIVKDMAYASSIVGVGPMAAVAGAIAEHLGKAILAEGIGEVIVENGGDIFLKLSSEKIVGIHAGESAFSDKLAFKVKPDQTPLGIATSAGQVGPSVSLGDTDAVVVVAKSTILADAAATSIANEVKGKAGVKKGLRKAQEIPKILGTIIIKDDILATWGKLPEIIQA
ncbi:MAG: UPF0280 family protein [Methanobacteriota archaeon]